MDQASFKQAIAWGLGDVRREIALAKAWATADGLRELPKLGIAPGGGNFMAALALLCYTEFGGKIKYNKTKSNGSDDASGNFNAFFDDLGRAYAAFRTTCNVYDIFRCGLAHEYYAKRDCRIDMPGAAASAGIGKDATMYFFLVGQYCDDLEKAMNALAATLPASPTSTVPISHSGYISGS